MGRPPSLFDFQVNGFAGIDYQNEQLTAAELRFSIERLRARAVAGIFLTLITDTEDRLCAQFERIERYRKTDPAITAMVCGYHLEGPWLRPQIGFCGAHPIDAMCAPTIAALERLQNAAGGNIRLVTLAPEWPGSAAVIAELTRQHVHVAIGHSDANDAEIDEAIDAGARFCTHLGNGVPGMLPRHDNVIQRLLARDELYACFIPDGIHLPPTVLKNLVRAKPPGRALFTTDAMAAADAPPGDYTLAGVRTHVGSDGVVRNPGATGGFAGSSLTPDRGVELTARYLGIPYAEAHRLWSDAPTSAFGISLPHPAANAQREPGSIVLAG